MKSPSESQATDGYLCGLAEKELTWNSLPESAPELANLCPKTSNEESVETS